MMDSKKSIMIIAGEPSGDRVGALLAQEILKKDPSVEITGLGGSLMSSSGVKLIQDITNWAVMGLIEVVKNYFNFRRVFNRVLEALDHTRPRLVVLIDFPGFNLRLAKAIHAKKIPVVYYVSPQIWAWHKHRIRLIRRVVDRMLVILPFEFDFYRKEGIKVDYVGHPLVDYYETYEGKRDVRGELKGSSPVIAILPGSRMKEIEKHLDPLLEAAKLTRENLKDICFVIPCATDMIYDGVCAKTKEISYIRVYRNSLKECLDASQLAWVCSGTATLETGYLGVPMIIFYKTSTLTAFFARCLIKVPHIGLINLVADKRIAPELVQEDFQPDRLSQKTHEMLSDVTTLKNIKEDLKRVRQKLGLPGASRRAAQIILEMLRV